jgi:hypothetical protein
VCCRIWKTGFGSKTGRHRFCRKARKLVKTDENSKFENVKPKTDLYRPGFLILLSREKVKMEEKTIIQLEGGNKIRRQSCKIGWQTYACKMKIFFFYLEEIRKVINNSWIFHLK